MNDELAGTISRLVGAQEERAEIFQAIKDQHAEEFERMDALAAEAETLRTAAAHMLRAEGKTQKLLGYEFKVAVPKTRVVDLNALLDRAKERRDIPALIEAGALAYTADIDQLDRLGGVLHATYAEFVRTEEATPRVTFPSALK